MFTLIVITTVIIASIVGGILIYRNNQKRFESAIKKSKDVVDVIKK